MKLRLLISLIAASLFTPACEGGGGVAADDATAADVGAADAMGDMAADSGPSVDVLIDGMAADSAPDASVVLDVPPADDISPEPDVGDPVPDIGEPDAVPPSEGACTNEQDEAALASFDPQTDLMESGMACYDMAGGPGSTDGDDVVVCLVEALNEEHGFTEPCAMCMAMNILCLQEHCMNQCMMVMMMPNADMAPCEACLDEAGCTDEVAQCSGLDTDSFSF